MIKVDHEQRKRLLETTNYSNLNILNHIINDYNNAECNSSFNFHIDSYERIYKITRIINILAENNIFVTMFVKDKKIDSWLRFDEMYDLENYKLRLFDDDLELRLFDDDLKTIDRIRWLFGENLEIENINLFFDK